MVWLVLILSLIFHSFRHFLSLWRPFPRTPEIMSITDVLIFHNYFFLLARSNNLSFCFLLLIYLFLLITGSTKSTRWHVFCSLSSNFKFGNLGKISWSIGILNPQWILCASFSRMDSGLWFTYSLVRSICNLFHNSLWITFPTKSCQVFYSSCNILLHLLTM